MYAYATSITLETGSDLTVFSNEFWYLVVPPATMFENNTAHCVAYNRIVQSKITDMGSCRWSDPEVIPSSESTWTLPTNLARGRSSPAPANGKG